MWIFAPNLKEYLPMMRFKLKLFCPTLYLFNEQNNTFFIYKTGQVTAYSTLIHSNRERATLDGHLIFEISLDYSMNIYSKVIQLSWWGECPPREASKLSMFVNKFVKYRIMIGRAENTHHRTSITGSLVSSLPGFASLGSFSTFK